jgi:general secretion pathway protein G
MIVRSLATRSARVARRTAFTLMEIMVVVAIIVILAGVSVVAVTRYMEQARIDATRAKIATIEKAVQDYYNRNHEYPASLEVLCQRDPTGLPAYLEEKDIYDEWNHPIILDASQRNATDRPKIYSNGGGEGGLISNW